MHASVQYICGMIWKMHACCLWVLMSSYWNEWAEQKNIDTKLEICFMFLCLCLQEIGEQEKTQRVNRTIPFARNSRDLFKFQLCNWNAPSFLTWFTVVLCVNLLRFIGPHSPKQQTKTNTVQMKSNNKLREKRSNKLEYKWLVWFRKEEQAQPS